MEKRKPGKKTGKRTSKKAGTKKGMKTRKKAVKKAGKKDKPGTKKKRAGKSDETVKMERPAHEERKGCLLANIGKIVFLVAVLAAFWYFFDRWLGSQK